jgi:hypothetical protein
MKEHEKEFWREADFGLWTLDIGLDEVSETIAAAGEARVNLPA